MSEKISDFKFKTPVAIRFADIDALGHVNNAIYLTYFEVARISYWREILQWDWNKTGIILGRAEVNYLKPITLHDKIECYVRTSRIGNSSFDVSYIIVKHTENGEEICTTGKTVCISYDYKSSQSVKIPADERARMIAYDEPHLIMN